MRAEMERCGAEYLDHLMCNAQGAFAWVTTKGILYSQRDEASGQWLHEWRSRASELT